MRVILSLVSVLGAGGCGQPRPATETKPEPPLEEKRVAAKEGIMDWDDPRDPIAITVPEVVAGQSPILLVIHDPGHGGWQFMDGKDVRGRKPKVIPKVELLKLDPSLAELKDLPVGWRARRASVKDPWVREKNPTGQ